MHQVLNHGREKNYDKEMNFGTNTCTPILSEYEWGKMKKTKFFNRYNERVIHEYDMVFRRRKKLFAIVPCNNTVVLAACRIYTDVKETVALMTTTTIGLGLRPRLIVIKCLVQLNGVCIRHYP